METFPSNSDRLNKKLSKEEFIEQNKVKESTGVSIRKKSKLRELTEGFFKGDLDMIKDNFINDIVIPTAKDAIITSISLLLWGDTSHAKTVSKVSSGLQSRVRYGSFYSGNDKVDRVSSEKRDFVYNNIEFRDKDKAINTLKLMKESIKTYGDCSIADMYDLAGVDEVPPHTYRKYGWRSLVDVVPLRVRSRIDPDEWVYVLDLPEVVVIK